MYRSEYLANLAIATSPKRSPIPKRLRYYQKPIPVPPVRPGFVLALMYAVMIAVGVWS